MIINFILLPCWLSVAAGLPADPLSRRLMMSRLVRYYSSSAEMLSDPILAGLPRVKGRLVAADVQEAEIDPPYGTDGRTVDDQFLKDSGLLPQGKQGKIIASADVNDDARLEDFMVGRAEDLYSFEDDYGNVDQQALEDYGDALNREVQDLMAQRMNKRSVDDNNSKRRKNIIDVQSA